MQIGRKPLRWVKAPLCNVLPIGPGHDLSIELLFPKHFQFGTLGVVVQTREPHHRLFRRSCRADNFFDQVLPRPDFDDRARFWTHAVTSKQDYGEESSEQ